MGTRRGVHGTPGDSIDTLYYHHTTSLPASPAAPKSISHHSPGSNIHQALVPKDKAPFLISSPRQARRKRPLPPSPEPELNPPTSNPQARSKPRLISSPRSKTLQKRDPGAQTPKAKSSSSRLTSGNTDEHMDARNFNDGTAAESSPLRRGMRVRRKRTLDMEDDDEGEDDLCNGQGVEGVRGSVGGHTGLVEGQEKESIQPRRKRLGQNTEAALLVAVAQHGEEHRVTKAMGEDLDEAADPSSLFSRLKIPRSLRTGVTRGRSMVPPAQVPSLWAPSSSQQTPSGGGSKEGKASPRGETSKGEGSQGYAGPVYGAPQGAPSPLQQQEHLKQVLAEVAGRCGTSRSASSSPKPSSLHALLTAASLASPLGPQTPQKPVPFSPDILSPLVMAAHPAITQTSTPLLSPEDINRQLALARELKTHIGLNQRFSLNSDMTRRISASVAPQPGPQQAMLSQALTLPIIPSTAATTTTSSAAAESANAPDLDAGSSGPSEDAEPTTGSVSPRAIDQTHVSKPYPARTVQTAPPNTPAHYINSLVARQSHAVHQFLDGGNTLDRADSLDRGNMTGHMNGVASARKELLAAVGELRMNGALASFNSSPLPASSSWLQEPGRQFELARAASALPQPVGTIPGMSSGGLEGMLDILEKKVKDEDTKSEGARKSDSGSAVRLTDEGGNATPGVKVANMEVEAATEGPRSSRRGGGRASRTKVNEGMEGACQHPHCKHGIWSTEPLKPFCFTHMKERGLCEVLGCKKWSRGTPDGGHLYCNQHMDLAYGAQPQQLQGGTRGILIKDGSSKIQQSPKPRSTPSPTPSSSLQPLSTTHSAATTPARPQSRQTPPNPHTPQPPTATTPSSYQNPIKPAPESPSPAASPAPTTLPPATLFSSPPSRLHLPSDDPVPTPDAPRKRARTKPRTPVAIRRLPSLTEEHPLATPIQTPFQAGPPDPTYQPTNDFTPHPQLTPAPPTPIPTAPAPSTKPSTKRRTATRSLPLLSPSAGEAPASGADPITASTPVSGKRRKLLSPKSSPTHPSGPNATHVHESSTPVATGITSRAHPTASMNGVANGNPQTPARAHVSAAAHGVVSPHGKAHAALFQCAPLNAAFSPIRTTNGALRSDDTLHGSSEIAGGGTGSTMAGGTASAAGSSMMEEEDGPQLLLHLATAAAAAARQQDDEDEEDIKDDAAVLGRLWEKRGSSNGRDRSRPWGSSDVNSEAQGEFERSGTSRVGSVAVTPMVTPLPTPGSVAGVGKLIGLVEGSKAQSAGFKPQAEGKRDWIKSGKQVRGQFEAGGTDALKVGGAGHANLFDLAAAAVTQYLSSVNSTRGNDRPPR